MGFKYIFKLDGYITRGPFHTALPLPSLRLLAGLSLRYRPRRVGLGAELEVGAGL